MQDKKVRASNLSLRFYRRDGWTEECLRKYLKKGLLFDSEQVFGDTAEKSYFTLDLDSELNFRDLYLFEVSEVEGAEAGRELEELARLSA